MAVVHVAVRDDHVVHGRTKLRLDAKLAALDGDAVVAHGEVAAQHAHKTAALGVKAVGVVGVLGTLDGKAQGVDVLGQDRVDVPRRAVAHGEAGHGDVGALSQEDHARTSDLAALLRAVDVLEVLVPPVVLGEVGLAVDGSAAIDADVLDAHAGKGGAVGREALALPTAHRRHAGAGVAVALLAVQSLGQVRERRAVVAGQKLGALGELDVDVALEEKGLDQVAAGGDKHAPALGAGHDRGLDVGGVVVLGVALGAAVAHVDGEGLVRSGHAHGELTVAVDEADDVATARLKAVDVGLDAVGGAGGLVVDEDLPGVLGGEVAAVVELDHGRAGTTPDNAGFHVSLLKR